MIGKHNYFFLPLDIWRVKFLKQTEQRTLDWTLGYRIFFVLIS